VLQSLVEKHFPAPDRSRIKKLLGNVGIELKHSKTQNGGDSQGPSGSGGNGEKRKSGINILTFYSFLNINVLIMIFRPSVFKTCKTC